MKTYLPANKHYFRIGEIARWLDEEAHVLRFWEEQFGRLLTGDVARSRRGQRNYTRAQAISFAAIQELLRVELYTIEGAKRRLRLAREREQSARVSVG